MTTESGASGAGADDLDLLADAYHKAQPIKRVDTIPDKYNGKSIEDIIQMHQNSERLAATLGNEVGSLRKLSEEILSLKKPTTQKTEERPPVTVDALLNDPEKAIRDAVANSDVTRRAEAAETRMAALEAGISERDFVSKYPNFAADINDPDFVSWINKNPLRQALAQRVAVKDFTAAKNLWEMHDEYKELTQGSKNESRQENTPAKRVPSTVKSSPSDGAKGKQVWSHAKLMELRAQVAQGNSAAVARWNDKGFQDRMHAAYAEDRIK